MELKGKKIIFIGDSITEGVGVSDINNRYDNRLRRMCGFSSTVNYGIGGTRFAYQSRPSAVPTFDLYFCGRAHLVDRSADIVVVYGGVNDYIHGDAPIGSADDRTPETFKGAVHYLMKFLSETFSGKPVVFMTPARCSFAGATDLDVSKNSFKRADAQPLAFYVDHIIETAKLYGVHVLDLYRDLPIDPKQDADREKYTTDGLHFNDAGHEVIAELLADFLKKL